MRGNYYDEFAGERSMKPSRRKMLKTVALAAGLAAVPWVARGQAKASKQAMQYQDQPKNGQTCDSCAQSIRPQLLFDPQSRERSSNRSTRGAMRPANFCGA